MKELKIAGWQKVSLIDYPGKVASVLFLAGCNMRCHYCHNQHILDATANQVSFRQVVEHLRRRRAWIDAVVVSGGEPTVYPQIIEVLRALKNLGLQVKLDTNGTKPEIIRKVIELNLVDFVALDIKAPADKYLEITGMSINNVWQSLMYLRQQKSVLYLLRTTLTPRLTQDDLIKMAKTLIKDAPVWQIQQCRCVGAYSNAEVIKIVKVLENYRPHVVLKNI